jgi:peptidoglycan/xylan/chitin deacetylase (PgdA/CDA1 family)
MNGLKIFYLLKPLIPRRLQIVLRRFLVTRKRTKVANIWPIDEHTRTPPDGWSGWPEKKRFAVILTHDVETMKGQHRCEQLMKLEQNLGFRSSFYFVPEKYYVWPHLRDKVQRRGFEVGVHGLYHDGKLYSSSKVFKRRAEQINRYLEEWGAVGFCSPSMHHNLDWLHALNIQYDISTFDTDPFEPQPEGVRTIFPFWVSRNSTQQGYVELPYTLPQDFTLFVIMKERSIDMWKKKLDWIADKGGMALLNTHPDYMNFSGGKADIDQYPAEYYDEFLHYIKDTYEGCYWHVLPKDIAHFWSVNCLSKVNKINHLSSTFYEK